MNRLLNIDVEIPGLGEKVDELLVTLQDRAFEAACRAAWMDGFQFGLLVSVIGFVSLWFVFGRR